MRDKFRKAAGYLIEFAPDEAKAEDSIGPKPNNLLAERKQATKLTAKKPTRSRNVEQFVRQVEGPSPGDASTPPPLVTKDGKVDFSAIYQQANLPAVPFTAEQMLEILLSLPPELASDTKRLTVKATLNTLGRSLGATEETIVADASRKLAALAAHSENISRQTTEYITNVQMKITALQARVEEKHNTIEGTRQKLIQFTQMCQVESQHLEDLLRFLQPGQEEGKK
ncbi:MAG: hypothetical protein AABN34_22965 [Acidobacteriota bacterium]